MVRQLNHAQLAKAGRKANKMATPSGTQTKVTMRSGISLENFEDVTLYKVVPQTLQVASLQEALAMVGNDENKLLALFTAGLNEVAVEEARKSNDGWKIVDDKGSQTEQVFTGTLVSPEILNPLVLQIARINHGWDEIPKGEKSAEMKRAAKENAMKDIKESPVILAGLKKKMASAS